MARGSYEPNGDERTPAAAASSGNGREIVKTKNKKDGARVLTKEEEIHELSPLQPLEERDEDAVKIVPVAPDGGYGWVIVVASFFCNFIVDGVAYSFSIYLTDWKEKFPNEKESTIALVGALLNGVYLLMGPISSALTNAFGFRIVIFSGAIIAAASFILSVFAKSVPFLLCSFGIMGGIGFGLIYSPSILCVCYYFNKKRAMAVGISVCGSGVGAFVFPPIMTRVVEYFGWQGSMFILAGLVLQVCVAGSLMRTLQVDVVEKVEFRPVVSPEQLPVGQTVSEKETLTYVRDAPRGAALNRTLSQEATAGNFRDLKHVDHERRDRNMSGTSGEVELVRSRKYSSKDGIDILHKDEQGRIIHDRQSGPYRQYSSQTDISDVVGTAKHHSEVAHPLDRKDVLVHGSLKRLSRQESEMADQVAFRRSSLKRRSEDKVVKSGDGSAKVVKKSWMPPQLRQALKEMIDVSIYKNPVFLIFSFASFLGMLAFYIPFTYVMPFALKEFGDSENIEKDTAALLISGIGGANTIGRIFWGWLADRPRSDPLLIHNVCVLIVGVVVAFVPLCYTYNSLMIVSVVFGFFVSPFISLLSIILTSRIGLDQLPSAFGQSQLVRGIATLTGTPIGGALYDMTQNYTVTFLASAGALIVASVSASMIFVLSFFSRKRKSTSGKPLPADVVA